MNVANEIAWPRKIHEMSQPAMDSTRWDDSPFGDDDMVIAAWAQSGTPWPASGSLTPDCAFWLGTGEMPD